ncbi:MAG: hypothetical protein ACYTE8_00355 [Planctomycetota bacterium]
MHKIFITILLCVTLWQYNDFKIKQCPADQFREAGYYWQTYDRGVLVYESAIPEPRMEFLIEYFEKEGLKND